MILWLLSSVITALAWLTASVTGFGCAMLFIPLMAVIYDAKSAVVLQVLIEVIARMVLILEARKSVCRRTLTLLVAGSLVGLPVGVSGLVRFSEHTVSLIIGTAVIVGSVAVVRGVRLPPAPKSTLRPLIVGVVSGTLRTLTGMAGPPVIVYLVTEGFSREQMRGTALAYFVPSTIIALGLLGLAGQISVTNVFVATTLIPGAAGGILLGMKLKASVNEGSFRTLVFLILLLAGLTAIVKALSAM